MKKKTITNNSGFMETINLLMLKSKEGANTVLSSCSLIGFRF